MLKSQIELKLNICNLKPKIHIHSVFTHPLITSTKKNYSIKILEWKTVKTVSAVILSSKNCKFLPHKNIFTHN
jgi:hypothetical protein